MSEHSPSHEFIVTRTAIEAVREASPVSSTEAAASIHGLMNRLRYALDGTKGHMILNRGVPPTIESTWQDVAQACWQYEGHRQRIRQHGYLPPETSTEFRRRFQTEAPKPQAGVLDDSKTGPEIIRMFAPSGIPATEWFRKIAQKLGLDGDKTRELQNAAAGAHRIKSTPGEGSNFLYSFSAPFIEAGPDESSRAGLLMTHKYMHADPLDFDRDTSFQGVDIPSAPALSLIQESIKPYTALAEEGKPKYWSDGPKLEPGYTYFKPILAVRDATLNNFVVQLKRTAPEISDVPYDDIRTVVKKAAESHYGSGKAYLNISPALSHIIDIATDPDTSFTEYADRDDPNIPALGKSRRPSFGPQSLQKANGRTGIVTRIDYTDRPGFPFSGKVLGRQEFDTSETERLRRLMFEAKINTLNQ